MREFLDLRLILSFSLIAVLFSLCLAVEGGMARRVRGRGQLPRLLLGFHVGVVVVTSVFLPSLLQGILHWGAGQGLFHWWASRGIFPYSHFEDFENWPDVTLVTVLWAFALVVWGIVLSDLTRARTSKQYLPHPTP